MAVGALEVQFYDELLRKLNFTHEEVPQFGNTTECREKLQNKFKEKTQEEWCKVGNVFLKEVPSRCTFSQIHFFHQIFDKSDACVTPVLSVEEASKHPHNLERHSYITDHEGDTVPAPAPRLEKNSPNLTGFQQPSSLGQHTFEVLSTLGYSSEKIQQLGDNGVVWLQEKSKY